MATDWVAGSRGRLSSLKTEVRNLYLGAETQVSAVATAEDLGMSLLPVMSGFR